MSRRSSGRLLRHVLLRPALALGILSWTCGAGTIVAVTSEGALGANDVVEWGQLGVNGTNLGSPVNFVSEGGLTGTATTTDPGGFLRLDSGVGWGGSFPDGDMLLNNLSTSLFPFTFSFSAPVFGAGALISADGLAPYVAEIDAFNGNNLLGTFFVSGTPGDPGTAPFLGVLDTVAEITSLQFTLANASQDFAIDSLELNTAATPEPGTAGLALAGLLAAGLYRWRRQS
jgi:MYXO-CTERM domain-containing protein